MRILVLNQYFHPDVASTGQLLTELCEDLAEHHRVTVVAGRPSYEAVPDGSFRGMVTEERHGRIRVLRTWSTTFPRRVMAGRLTNYATYLASCLVGAIRSEPPDVVLTMTDPPVVAAAAMVASRFRSVPFVFVHQDVFPDVGVVLGKIHGRALEKTLTALNRALRREAAAVVAIGRDMERRLLDDGVPRCKVTLIPNWADGSVIRPLKGRAFRDRMGWGDRFVVMHSGNVGLSQDLETLVEAGALLSDHRDIVIAIVGDGAGKAGLQREVARRGLRNIVFLPYQPKTELSESLGAADVHVVSLKQGLAERMVPSKVYGIMAAGKPFIGAVEPGSETALVLEEHGCGLWVGPGDGKLLARAILRIRREPLEEMGRRAREALETRFDRPLATRAYRELLERVAIGQRPSG
jgi:colanic acid biosynthesis glycosyl transferase WcaI